MLILVLCGVEDESIVDDYAATEANLRHPRAAALGRADDHTEILRVLQAHGLQDVREAMRRALEDSDVFGDLRRGGFQDADVEVLRARMLTDI